MRGRDLDPAHRYDVAAYMIDWVRFLREEEGLPVRYLSLHNEGEDWERWPADGATRGWPGHDYNLYWPPEQVVDFLRFMRSMLDAAGLQEVGLTPGETTNWFRFAAWGYAGAIADDAGALANLGLITSHGFLGSDINNRWYGPHTSRGIDAPPLPRTDMMARHLIPRAVPALLLLALCILPLRAQDTETLYLSGTGPDDAVEWAFMVSGGRRAGTWATIPVPSHWEQHGFGAYNYGHDWRNGRRPLADEVGHYRHRFTVPADWRGRRVEIVFDGAMTDAGVRVNGRSAGPRHQGAFYRFRHDVSGLLRYGQENVLEVDVAKVSSNASVNAAEREADFWIFGGLFRPVWLEAYPAEHVARVALDPKHTGAFYLEAFPRGLTGPAELVARVTSLDGEPVGPALRTDVAPADSMVVLRGQIDGVRPWSPEWPHLYYVDVTLVRGDAVLHRARERFGFRTVEVVKGDGVYVNGVRVHLKGVNRHSFWPETGRATTRAQSVADALLVKEMNMNAVRSSHYPPDKHFLEAADSLGLFVIDELTGWQDAYDSEVGARLVRELVLRDVNHPSVLFWANGNEGGFNHDLLPLYAAYDPQQRTVLHPWDNFGGIETTHYRDWGCCAGQFFEGTDIILPTEFLHGLYDGGHGAGLQDWWRELLRNPLGGGGFLWAFADEALLRTDLGDTLDTDGNHGPDGILGPHREKEGSFYAIREIWSPVYVPLAERETLPARFDGRLRVENRYYFTNLEAVDFAWQLVRFPGPADAPARQAGVTGTAKTAAEPWMTAVLDLGLPAGWQDYDALYLTATDPHGHEIFTWSWMTKHPDAVLERVVQPRGAAPAAEEAGGRYVLRAGGTAVEIDRATGMLARVERDGQTIPLAGGPRLVSGPAYTLTGIRQYEASGAQVVEATYDGALRHVRWAMHPGGWLELDYRFGLSGSHDLIGATFDVPEAHVTGLTWLGQGPYRVWKNRPHGLRFDVHTKAYNDAVTGLVWDYPEFKGYHADLYWATLHTDGVPVTVVTGTPNLFLHVLTPRQPGEPGSPSEPRHTAVPFPEGDLSFLHAIPAIGTKFRPAPGTGPSGQPNQAQTHYQDLEKFDYHPRLYFYFGGVPLQGTE